MTFGAGKCTIHDENKEVVGVIAKTVARVYKVKHEEVGNEVEEQLTLGCFHHQMGHVSPETAQKLIKDKMVVVQSQVNLGIQADPNESAQESETDVSSK